MGFGAWGALAGLGQGLQQGAGMFLQGRQLDERAKMDALQLALQQEASARQQQQLQMQQQGQEQDLQRWLVANSPSGLPRSPDERQRREDAGLGTDVRPDLGFDPQTVLERGLPVREGGDPSSPTLGA